MTNMRYVGHHMSRKYIATACHHTFLLYTSEMDTIKVLMVQEFFFSKILESVFPESMNDPNTLNGRYIFHIFKEYAEKVRTYFQDIKWCNGKS